MQMREIKEFLTSNKLLILESWKNRLSIDYSYLTAVLGEDVLNSLLYKLLLDLEKMARFSSSTTGRERQFFFSVRQFELSKLTAGDLLTILGQLKWVVRRFPLQDSIYLEVWEEFVDQYTSKIVESFIAVRKLGYSCQEKELKILREFNQIMRNCSGTQEIFGFIAKVLMRYLKAKSLILLLDRTGRELRSKASSGLNQPAFENLRMSVDGGIIGRSIAEKTTLLIRKIREEKKICYPKLFLAEGIDSLLAIPLYNREKTIGAVVFLAKDEWELRSEGISFLINIANHIGVVIGKTMLYEDVYENYLYTIKALIAAIDAKDNYTSGHSERVMEYAVIISESMGLT